MRGFSSVVLAACLLFMEVCAMAEQWDPVAEPSACVLADGGRARFTILTDRLIRMEWSASGSFEDRASQAFVHRATPTPVFTVERAVGTVRIRTDRLRLFFREEGKSFHPGNLTIEGSVGDEPFIWSPGMAPSGNLGGTTRTLDNVNGSCPVEPGILSRDGWAVVDDSASLVFDARPALGDSSAVDGWPWLTPRGADAGVDWYFFGHGRAYGAALRDFTLVAGKIPLPPRYVFGSWWSRYWAYTDQELKDLVHEFRTHDVPLDVLVIDMDWHLDGWTGYTWSPAHFPDPDGFLKWTDQQGLQITLNLHPADGVGKHETMFRPMCEAMGLDASKTDFVSFDCTDPRYVDAYFRLLHWPIEQQGVDFWWMDWQQGTRTNTPGLDPLWWLNHLHWKDLEVRQEAPRDPTGVRVGRRPLIFSRWGGLGNHRYPIGFSGDTYSTWASLAWQPEFTAKAGNVGYAYWSHDIGGHQPGPVDPELYARWVQYAVLSPVLRTHTSKNPLGERRIWASPERSFKAMREAFALRYRLIPYIYTASRRTYDTSLPLCRPLAYHWPEADESYDPELQFQYLFGDDLLAAPVVRPADQASGAAMIDVWIPPGAWTNWFTGETIEGPVRRALHVPLDEIPMFARSGAITPAAPAMRWSSEKPLDPLTLIVWPGGVAADGWRQECGSGELYEDDGESGGYARGQCRRTRYEMHRSAGILRLKIGAAEGTFAGARSERAYEVRIVDRWPARAVRVDGVALEPGEHGWRYDEAKLTIVVSLASRVVDRPVEIEIELDEADESPLRGGIHGMLKMYESLGRLLGEHAPAALREAARGELRRGVIESRGGSAAGAFASETRWAIARDVASCGAADVFKQEAIARILGVSSSTEVWSDEDGTIRTRATARRLPGVGPRDIEMRVSSSPSGAWARQSCEDRSGGDACEERCAWSAARPLRTTRLRSKVEVRRGAESVFLHAEREILPSIGAWWVVGPFDCPFAHAMKTPFGPERTGGMQPSGRERYDDGRGGTVGWRRIERVMRGGDDPSAEFVVDLHKAFGERRDHAVAYGLIHLKTDRACEALLALGSDDGAAVWVNGEKVHENDVQRGYGSMQDRVPIRLREGRNTLLIKITQAFGGWSFGAHLLNVEGGVLKGVEVEFGA